MANRKQLNKTPIVSFDGETGILSIQGRSISENAYAFYHPYIEWVEEYIQAPKAHTQLNIKLEYFNSSSLKSIMILIKRLEDVYLQGYKVTLNWYYEEDDEDMLNEGKNCQSLFKIPFNFIKSKEE